MFGISWPSAYMYLCQNAGQSHTILYQAAGRARARALIENASSTFLYNKYMEREEL